MSDPLPQMFQALPKGVDGEDVDDAHEVALLRSIDDMQRVFEVGQETPVLGPEVGPHLLRTRMKTTTT